MLARSARSAHAASARRAARSRAGSRRARRRRRHRSTRSPRLRRTDASASSRVTPIAASTCDGSVAPDEHEEPAAAHTPAWSSATSSVSASTPRNPRCALPATLARAVAVLEHAGNRGGQAVDQAVAQGGDADDVGGARIARRPERGGHRDRPGDVRRARPQPAPPGRRPRSTARSRSPLRTTSAPVPLGPPNLCAEIATRSTPAAAAATSIHGTACTASVCTTALGARSRTPATILSSGWIVPTSLFTSITDTIAVRSSTAASNRSRSTTPDSGTETASTRKPSAASRSHDASTPLCSNAVVTTPSAPRVARAAAGDPLHREVVGLGAAGGEHDLGRSDGEQLGDLLPGLLERRLGRPGRGVAAARVAERALQERRHRRHRLGPHRGGGGVIQVGERRFHAPKSTEQRATGGPGIPAHRGSRAARPLGDTHRSSERRAARVSRAPASATRNKCHTPGRYSSCEHATAPGRPARARGHEVQPARHEGSHRADADRSPHSRPRWRAARRQLGRLAPRCTHPHRGPGGRRPGPPGARGRGRRRGAVAGQLTKRLPAALLQLRPSERRVVPFRAWVTANVRHGPTGRRWPRRRSRATSTR